MAVRTFEHRLGLLAVALAVSAAATPSLADVVVSYDRAAPTFGRAPQEVLRQHGQRIRVDSRPVASRPGAASLRQVFTRAGQAATFELGRFEDGRWAYLSVMDDPLSAPPPKALRAFTGETQTLLGERCRVWRLARGTPQGFAFVRSGCVTADGVELWRRQGNIDAVFARKVSREPVPAGAVRVPTEALDLAAWATPAKPARHSGDYEVVLEAGPSEGPRETARRSGAWTSTLLELPGLGSTLNVTNIEQGLGLQYSRHGDGTRSLSLYRRRGLVGGDKVRLGGRGDETILGARCQWWDMMPGVEDAGRTECRTADGVALKVERITRGQVTTLTAVRFARGRQPLAKVMPGRDIASPSAWGF
jgi:hypothetical protein